MLTSDFDFELPADLIAQQPVKQRESSRLLALHRTTGSVSHQLFRNFPDLLRAGDVLVLNDSKVLPARLKAFDTHTGREFEVLLFDENGVNDWWTMMKPGGKAPVGKQLRIITPQVPLAIHARVEAVNAAGHRRLRFSGIDDLKGVLDEIGEIPLPPYIKRAAPSAEDRDRYQTVYARERGSVAAPTAGLHFTGELLDEVRRRGVDVRYLTLHVGPGTFAPVKTEQLESHRMHEEHYTIPQATAVAVTAAKEEKRRVVAVGTTTVRVLENAGRRFGPRLEACSGATDIFIYPPAEFLMVDALLTNFHLPRSTLVMLVSAFASPGATTGRDIVLSAYEQAVKERYRFFSYGDAMFIY